MLFKLSDDRSKMEKANFIECSFNLSKFKIIRINRRLKCFNCSLYITRKNEDILFSMKYSLRETLSDRKLFERGCLDRAVEPRNPLVFPFVLDTRYITMTLREHAFTSGAKNL